MDVRVRRFVVWLLLAALPLQGLAALVHCDHRYAAPASTAHGVSMHHGHPSDVAGTGSRAAPHQHALGSAAADEPRAADGDADPSAARCATCAAGCCLGAVLTDDGAAARMAPAHPGTAAPVLAVGHRVDVLLRPPRTASPG